MKITKEQLEELYLKQCKTRKEIANILNCSEGSVRSHIAKYKLLKSKEQIQQTKELYKITKEQLEELYSNHSLREVSKITSLSITYIRKLIKKYSIIKSREDIDKQHLISIKKTNLEKYGTEWSLQNKEIRNKIHQTNLEKTDEEKNLIIEKRKKTNLEKYGTEWSLQNKEIRNKIHQTNLEKYGAISPLLSSKYCGHFSNYSQTDLFKKQYMKRMIEKYDVDNYSKSLLSEETRNIIYNKDNFIQYIKQNNYTTVDEISFALKIGKTIVIKKIHEYEFDNIIQYNVSSYEKYIREYISQYYDIETNNRKILDGQEIDIYIPKLKLGIEFNGNYWHGELNKEVKYHQNKSLLAESKGIFIYHIFEYEWNTKKDKILNQLNNLLGINQFKIGARKCIIKEVSNKEKNEFLMKNHLQGDDSSSIKLGLYYENKLVSLMTFCKPRFNKKYEWELSRFCSLAGYNVIGGASKLFKYFIDNYTPKSIISYSNIAHTKGNLYSNVGFTLMNISDPNYIWIHGNEYLTRYQCQKHKLLEQGFKGISEIDIMRKRKFYRLYDCGNKVWVYNHIDKSIIM